MTRSRDLGRDARIFGSAPDHVTGIVARRCPGAARDTCPGPPPDRRAPALLKSRIRLTDDPPRRAARRLPQARRPWRCGCRVAVLETGKRAGEVDLWVLIVGLLMLVVALPVAGRRVLFLYRLIA